MANHKSALKRVRQTAKRRLRNRHVMTMTRTYIKRLRAAVDSGNAEQAKEALLLAVEFIAHAASASASGASKCGVQGRGCRAHCS